MKAILLGRTDRATDTIPYAQLFPFFDNKKRLRHELNLDVQHIEARALDIFESVGRQANADVFFVRPCWREDPAQVESVMQELRHRQPSSQIVFIDPFDQTSSRFFGVLPYVDHFLKYQRLKDTSQYHQPLKGGTVLTDYLARKLGYDLKEWSVQSTVPEGYESKIKTGWFVTLHKPFQDVLFHQPRFWQRKENIKDIDVFCHVSYGPRSNLEWYGQHRILGIEKLKCLAPDYTLSVSGDFSGEQTISSRQYSRDIKRSRIAFSPFGWGEITGRDYEAVCNGCLLIKPAVDHIDTEPNIFIPGQTYVPVRWDFADLEEKCRYYLTHPDETAQIVYNAREAYRAYFTKHHFVRKIKSLVYPNTSVEPSIKSLVSASS